MLKPVLYCSVKCAHSKELLDVIKAKSILEMFKVHIIEQEKERLPPFVDRVPLLFHNNKILHDEGLFMYIQSINERKQNIDAFAPESSISDSFSFIDAEKGNDHSYLYVNDRGDFEDQKINTPPESSDDAKNMSLEQLMSKRERDLP